VATHPPRAPPTSLLLPPPWTPAPPSAPLSSALSSPGSTRPPAASISKPTAVSAGALADDSDGISPPSPEPCASGDAASPRASTGTSAADQAPSKATSAFVLKRKESERTRKIDRAEGSGGTPSPSEPAQSARPSVVPRVERQGQYEAGSLAVFRLICLAANQLLSLVYAVPKWTGIWLVLEAGDETAAAPFIGKVINCAAGETATAERDALASDWWEFRGGNDGRRQRQRAQAGGDEGSDMRLGNPGVDGTAPATTVQTDVKTELTKPR